MEHINNNAAYTIGEAVAFMTMCGFAPQGLGPTRRYHIGKTGTLAAVLCVLAEPARFDSSLSDPRPPLESCSSFFWGGTQTLSHWR